MGCVSGSSLSVCQRACQQYFLLLYWSVTCLTSLLPTAGLRIVCSCQRTWLVWVRPSPGPMKWWMQRKIWCLVREFSAHTFNQSFEPLSVKSWLYLFNMCFIQVSLSFFWVLMTLLCIEPIWSACRDFSPCYTTTGENCVVAVSSKTFFVSLPQTYLTCCCRLNSFHLLLSLPL